MSGTRAQKARIRREGFTLVEILVVVLILGILASLAIVNMTGKAKKAKVTATRVNIQNIKLAIAEYEMQNGRFPESLEDLVSGSTHYLDQETVPSDAWGKEFNYYLKGDLVKVRSAGPDGTFDTEDDIVNK